MAKICSPDDRGSSGSGGKAGLAEVFVGPHQPDLREKGEKLRALLLGVPKDANLIPERRIAIVLAWTRTQ